MPNSLAGRDILSTQDLDREEILLIFEQATQFEEAPKEAKSLDLLEGHILATMFYEPSTRTRLSFESAMHRLGGDVISVAEAMKSSSAKKGESLEDAARVISGYADVIVQRHPEPFSAQDAAKRATVPVINGGDGSHEHPTQALLDLYTIQKEREAIDGLHIALVGDLLYGRTVHSLAQALVNWDVTLTLVSPPSLKMAPQLISKIGDEITLNETDDLEAALDECDVLYMTRIQKERFSKPSEYEEVKGTYVLDVATIQHHNPDVTIMHPLPRVNEIKAEVDKLPGAAYFRQAANGVWVRMALLALVLDVATVES